MSSLLRRLRRLLGPRSTPPAAPRDDIEREATSWPATKYLNPATQEWQATLPEGYELADGMVFAGSWGCWDTWWEIDYHPGDYRHHDFRGQFWAENG